MRHRSTERDGGGELFGTAHPTHWNGRRYLIERESGNHLRFDEPWGDTVDRDIAARQFDCEGLGRTNYPGLRGTVVDLAAVTHDARDRGQGNDAAGRRVLTNGMMIG